MSGNKRVFGKSFYLPLNFAGHLKLLWSTVFKEKSRALSSLSPCRRTKAIAI